MLLRRRLARRIRFRAALGAARVVGEDRPVGEVLRQRAKASGYHRSDQHEGRAGAVLGSPDVVRQHGARDVQGWVVASVIWVVAAVMGVLLR